MKYDFLVVGAGLYGTVFAQQAKEAGRSVKVIEKRGHIGGNCSSFNFEDTGIIVHRYGTHIFHCSDRAIWEYINRFTEFNRYQHRVLAMHHGRVYPMPICLGTLNQFFGLDLEPKEVEGFLASKRYAFPSPSNFEEKALSLMGRDIYEAFIKGYTAKQWGCAPSELPASIITRLPFRSSYHDAYFDDPYQGIPVDGYQPMFERMLEGIDCELNVDFLADKDWWSTQAGTVVYTGPIDRYFDFRLGRLGWRSVRFEVTRLELEDFQGTSVMNYADIDVPFTRIHEPKHLHRERSHMPNTTVICREYSHVDNNEPYYPVNTDADRALYQAYRNLAAHEPNVAFGGRLATYRYYDMHQVIAAALIEAKRALSGE